MSKLVRITYLFWFIAFSTQSLAVGHEGGFIAHLLEPFFSNVGSKKGLDTTLGTDSNISRAQEDKNIISDRFARVDGKLTVKGVLSFNKALILDLYGGHQLHEFTSSLDQTTLGSRLTYRWQNDFSYDSPWYQVFGQYEYWLSEVKQRTSHVYNAQAMASARFTTKIRWVAGYEYQQRLSEGEVFDTNQNRLFFNLDYDFRNGYAVYGAYGFIKGDTLSSVQNIYCNGNNSTSIYSLITSSQAIEQDQAFSQDYCGNWLAYRLDATTHSATLGLNYALGHKAALDASLLVVKSIADDDIEYDRQIFQLTLLMAFK